MLATATSFEATIKKSNGMKKKTPYENRYLHIDATGSLVKIPLRFPENHGTAYNRILNHYLILKNSSLMHLKQSSVKVGELITSRHDVRQLKSFLNDYKFDYKKLMSDQCHFRLIIIDYSWVLIHSILRSINEVSVIDYANRIFRLANGVLSELNRQNFINRPI
ncbi:unnamed protein product [Brachionus calyciflorus]|uniref:Uncharacterized protein n=1 Tax=Brachionus calyciflorus TaxID=104777 RepID=A0A814KIU9_9BILA|nr:unnamed protein product [Brachionus calyciflorus]